MTLFDAKQNYAGQISGCERLYQRHGSCISLMAGLEARMSCHNTAANIHSSSFRASLVISISSVFVYHLETSEFLSKSLH